MDLAFWEISIVFVMQIAKLNVYYITNEFHEGQTSRP